MKRAEHYSSCPECGEIIEPGDAIEPHPSMLEGHTVWVCERCALLGGLLW